MATNQAAYLTYAKSRTLSIRSSPYPTPGPTDLIIRTKAVAINPLDFKIQDTNPAIGGKPLSYPLILGADISGTIIAVGTAVTKRRIGDRVIANAPGLSSGDNARAGFQEFVLIDESEVVALPEEMREEDAVVLPLACDTATAGLFSDQGLGLSTSSLCEEPTSHEEEGAVVLIWGASSSVGCCAVQLCRAAGYSVVCTAGEKNFELCIGLGAEEVFEHRDKGVEKGIVRALRKRRVVGVLDCVASADTIEMCARILSKCRGGEQGRKRVVTVLTPDEHEIEGVEIKRLSIPALRKAETYTVLHRWMEKALASGALMPKPDAMIVGQGLSAIQSGLDTLRKGVSAKKLVVKM